MCIKIKMSQYLTILQSNGNADQIDCRIEFDPTVCEMPLDGTNQACSNLGLKVISWTAILKIIVPALIA